MDVSLNKLFSWSVAMRVARDKLGKVLELDTEYPTAMLPALSMAALPIQRHKELGLKVDCW
jgi:hypothetical protein